jgi:hypothetical protein
MTLQLYLLTVDAVVNNGRVLRDNLTASAMIVEGLVVKLSCWANR